MRYFNDYAQQLEMESIGKQPNKNSIFQKTGQIVFGGFGSTAQALLFSVTTPRNIVGMCGYIYH
jgi:glucose-6-phosphate isomerase